MLQMRAVIPSSSARFSICSHQDAVVYRRRRAWFAAAAYTLVQAPEIEYGQIVRQGQQDRINYGVYIKLADSKQTAMTLFQSGPQVNYRYQCCTWVQLEHTGQFPRSRSVYCRMLFTRGGGSGAAAGALVGVILEQTEMKSCRGVYSFQNQDKALFMRDK